MAADDPPGDQPAQPVAGHGIIGLERARIAESGARGLGVCPGLEATSEIEVGLGVAGHELGQSVAFGEVAVLISPIPQDSGEVLVRVRVLGLDPDGRAEFGRGAIEVPLRHHFPSETKVAGEVVGLQRGRFTMERGEGLVAVGLGLQRHVELLAERGVGGPEPDRLADLGESTVEVVLPLECLAHLEMDQGDGVLAGGEVGPEPAVRGVDRGGSLL